MSLEVGVCGVSDPEGRIRFIVEWVSVMIAHSVHGQHAAHVFIVEIAPQRQNE